MTLSARGLVSALVLVLACACGVGGSGGEGAPEGGALDGEEEVAANVRVFRSDRRVSHNSDTDARIPSVAAWGRDVYVAWEDGRYDGVNVYFNRSRDRGVAWLPYDIRLDTDTPGAADSHEPMVAIDEGAVYVTWTDRRSGPDAVHFSMSPDGGVTWPVSDQRIDMNPSAGASSFVPHIAVHGRFVFVDWVDDRHNPSSFNYDAYGRMSEDGGRHWAEPAIITQNTPGTAYVARRELARAGEAVVYAAWTDDRVSPATWAMNVYFNRSLDAGATWGRRDVDLTRQAGPTPSIYGHGMAAWGDRICIAWTRELTPGAFAIRARRSDDAGGTWSLSPETVLHAPGVVSKLLGPEVVSAGDHVFVTWVDDRSTTSQDVYLNLAPWTGAFAAADVRLNVPPSGATAAGYLDITTGDGAAYVVWNDDRDGHQVVYMNTARP